LKESVASIRPEPMLTVVFFGKTGVGKSSTLNALFGLELATDPAVACTSEPQVTVLDPEEDPGLPDEPVRVVDMPGIAESLRAEDLYQPYYEKWIPQADSLVWVTQADTRAYKRDQLYLMKLLPLLRPSLQFVVALNRVDDLGVEEGDESFNTTLGRPSAAQLAVLPEKISDVYGVFKEILGDAVPFDKSHVVPYTALHGWGLEQLKRTILKEVEHDPVLSRETQEAAPHGGRPESGRQDVSRGMGQAVERSQESGGEGDPAPH